MISTTPDVAQPGHDLDLGVIYTHEREWMTPLVESLLASSDGISARLILVDNASREGVTEWQDRFAETLVLRNDQRLGYAANLNRILASSTARYVLLLNTDMLFLPNEQTLPRMVRFMDQHPACGGSICRLVHGDGQFAYPARRFQDPRTFAARRLGMARWFPGWLDHYLYRDRDPTETFECDWISGCFLMLRQEAARAVGPFDRRFVKYFEDVDYCARLWQQQFRVMYFGGTSVIHYEQRASGRILSQDAWRHAQSYWRFLRKWGWKPRSSC